MWLTLGLDLSKPCRWSQVCLEQAYLVVVKDAVKFGLTDGPDLLQGVTSSIAVVCTEAQVHICSVIQNPQLYAPVVNPIAQHERMQAIRKVLSPPPAAFGMPSIVSLRLRRCCLRIRASVR